MEKSYYYILHIPTNTILSYTNKYFSKYLNKHLYLDNDNIVAGLLNNTFLYYNNEPMYGGYLCITYPIFNKFIHTTKNSDEFLKCLKIWSSYLNNG